MSEEKECFVIAPIGEEDTEIRKISDRVFKKIIEPVVNTFSYRAIRADHISEPGMITQQIIKKIINSDLVIADLSGHNPNVFYELAVRHASRKPVIQMIRKGEKLPFDIADMRTIFYEEPDLDNYEEFKEILKEHISSLDKDKIVMDNPIATSMNLNIFEQSKNPNENMLAQIIELISDVRSRIMKLETRKYSDRIEESLRRELSKIAIDGILVGRPHQIENTLEHKSNIYSVEELKEFLKKDLQKISQNIRTKLAEQPEQGTQSEEII